MAASSMQRLLWRQATRPACTGMSSLRSTASLSSLARAALPKTRAPSSTVARSLIARRLGANTPRRPYSSQRPNDSNQKVKFWPFLLIIGAGFAGYASLVNRRIVEMPQDADNTSGQLPAPPKPTPTFSPDDVTVVFVLGGPGAGKGTQCANLVKDYGFTHLSAGDLLRAEQERPGSQFGEMIKDYIKNGLIVPMEVTVQLLENAMTEDLQRRGTKQGKFLIDGFPRKLDQAHKFEEAVCPARFVLFFDCSEAEMERRLLDRGKTSGRSDDNADSIRKRFRTFVETSMPVVDYYETQSKVVRVNAERDPEVVHKDTQKLLEAKLGKDF